MKWLLLLGKTLLAIALVVGIIAFAVSAGGCASVFNAPPPPPKYQPAEYLRSNDSTPVLCWYERDGVAWWMSVPRDQCAGWSPL